MSILKLYFQDSKTGMSFSGVYAHNKCLIVPSDLVTYFVKLVYLFQPSNQNINPDL